MGLHPALAAVRLAVRRSLSDLAPGDTVLVACSGGADSLALLDATVFEARRPGFRVIGATVDHGLQEGSETHTARVADQMRALGVAESVTARVVVDAPGMGPEAAAREARYAVLAQLAERFGAVTVLLGHTLDDQAETVLLGLTRGSGAKALAGMRRGFEIYRRPLLDVRRADTETACMAAGLTWWSDPHNEDEGFTRVRVRRRVLPMLEDALGPGVAETLARTADQLRADTGYLDEVAAATLVRLQGQRESKGSAATGLPVAELSALPEAIRRRVLRLAALAAGAVPAELFHTHVLGIDRLLTDWRGQTGIDLPGHLRAVRADGVLRFESSG